MDAKIAQLQLEICTKYHANHVPVQRDEKVGIAQNVNANIVPINGLRLHREGDTSGWYIWAGEELSQAPDFFVPLHIQHLDAWCPEVIPYPGLPPGWRFLIAPGHEDVSFDPDILN